MRNLSNNDIDRALNKVPEVRAIYQGAYPHNRLHTLHLSLPAMLVVNTDPHNLPGKHWISIYINANRQGEVFDSLASPLSNHIIRFMNTWTRHWVTNSNMYQHPLSQACGIFVIYHLTNRLYYPSLSTVLQTFSANMIENECIMSAYYRRFQ